MRIRTCFAVAFVLLLATATAWADDYEIRVCLHETIKGSHGEVAQKKCYFPHMDRYHESWTGSDGESTTHISLDGGLTWTITETPGWRGFVGYGIRGNWCSGCTDCSLASGNAVDACSACSSTLLDCLICAEERSLSASGRRDLETLSAEALACRAGFNPLATDFSPGTNGNGWPP